MHGSMVGHRKENNKGRTCKIKVTKMGCIIPRMKKQVKSIPISADYMWVISKNNRLQIDDKLSKLTDHFSLPNQHEHLCNMEREGEDTSQK